MTVEHLLRVTLATGSLLLLTGIVLNNSFSKTAGAVLMLLCFASIAACVIIGIALAIINKDRNNKSKKVQKDRHNP